MASASRDLLAPREHVWGFLAEPNHLADWWPGIVGVAADRRGFSEGARWVVSRREEQTPLAALLGRLPSTGRSGKALTETLVITTLHRFELWAWELIGRQRGMRALRPLRAEVRLQAAGRERTCVTVAVTSDVLLRWTTNDPRTARTAVDRLYDLVQTAAVLE